VRIDTNTPKVRKDEVSLTLAKEGAQPLIDTIDGGAVRSDARAPCTSSQGTKECLVARPLGREEAPHKVVAITIYGRGALRAASRELLAHEARDGEAKSPKGANTPIEVLEGGEGTKGGDTQPLARAQATSAKHPNTVILIDVYSIQ